MVSIMLSGAGSVAVSARPAFPNTVATSGKFSFKILSVFGLDFLPYLFQFRMELQAYT